MTRHLLKSQYRDLLWGLGLLCGAAALLRWPQDCMQAVREGLRLCGNVILPSLFPFFVLSSLVVELGLSRYLGKVLEPVMVPLFRVNGTCASALALGVVGGYPVGARTAIALYESGQCSKVETERMLAFCNNSGSAFILGVVGTGIFGSSAAGMLLYLTHVAASLIVGLLFRFYRPDQKPGRGRGRCEVRTAAFAPALTKSITGALSSVLNISAFVIFFSVALRALTLAGVLDALAGVLAVLLTPLGLPRPDLRKLVIGLVEMSSGVATLSDGGTLAGRLPLAAFMLGWAGLSVHCQVMSFLADSGLSIKTYLAGKLLHGGLSAALTALAVRWMPLGETTGAWLTQQLEMTAQVDFHKALALSALWAWGVWLAFLGVGLHMLKKSSGKKRRNGV